MSTLGRYPRQSNYAQLITADSLLDGAGTTNLEAGGKTWGMQHGGLTDDTAQWNGITWVPVGPSKILQPST